MSKARSKLIAYSDRTFREVRGFTTEVHFGRQEKHFPSRKGFIPGRSPVTIGIVEVQRLIELRAGTGDMVGRNKELVEFGRVIGAYVNSRTGKSVPTTRGAIHYSVNGAHLVPAPPKPPKQSGSR